MNKQQKIKYRGLGLVAAVMSRMLAASPFMRADTGTCNGASITMPFNDVASSNIFFCSIASAYFFRTDERHIAGNLQPV
jgi:hypothetical protein